MLSFKELYSFEHLYNAYRLAARGKHNQSEVIRYEMDLAHNLWQLSREIESGVYHPSGYHKFMIYDPKEREIQALSFRDRVVQHSLCDNLLAPWFENRLIYDCAACRIGKGTHFALDRLSGFLRAFYRKNGTNGYILKMDVRKYFDSIDHDVLKYLLRKYPEQRTRDFLYMVIDSYHADTGKGLPMGNQTSQWFALYYLDRIDRMIKEQYHIRYYTRYMDDMVLIHESKLYLQHILEQLTKFAGNELKLAFNQKTQIFPISQGVDYLGWHFYMTDTGKVIRRLRTANKRRFKRRLKAYQEQYRRGEKDLDAIQRSLASYRGHLKHGHTYKLQAHVFDRFVLTKAEKPKSTENDPE